MDPDLLLQIAKDGAREAGVLLLERFSSTATGVDAKSTPTDPVSDADRDSEKLIVSHIRAHRAEDAIVAEEGAVRQSDSGLTWIIDPLDGTVNFLFGIPVWSVSIAVEDPEGPLAGVVFDPNRGEMFSATRDRGAHLNGERLEVSHRTDLAHALVGTGFSYDARVRVIQAEVVSRVLPVVRDIRRAGSAALDLAAVACGRLDAFYEAPMEWWDRAAGVLLIKEAGGFVSDLPAPFDLSAGVIAGNTQLHDALASLVAS